MDFIIEERPVKLFGITLWWRKVIRPTTNELMRRVVETR
jgi:hypothetical protein